MISSASAISYLLALAFGDNLTECWRIALLFPGAFTIFRLICFLGFFRFESPRWILQCYTQENQLVNESEARKKIRRIFRVIYKAEIVEDVLERECSIFKKTSMMFKPTIANMFCFPYKFRLFAGFVCAAS